MTAADILVDELLARGVPYIAPLNGHGLDPFYLACRRAGMRMIESATNRPPATWPRLPGG